MAIEKLRKTEIKKILAETGIPFEYLENMVGVDIYHYHEWDHGYDGHTGFCGTRREFYSDFFEMKSFLKAYISAKGISHFVVSPLHQVHYFNPVSDSALDIYDEIDRFLKEQGIDKRYETGLRLSVGDNWEFIDALCEGAYRNVSNAAFLSEEAKTVLIPHHHMNIHVYASDLNKEKMFLSKLISPMPSIRLFAKDILN